MKKMDDELKARIDAIPKGHASDKRTPGCLVLEGGAWRGLYTEGVVDALMQMDVNMQTVIGVSAGAMTAISYVSGQIGRAPHINLMHRHDSEYCGIKAFRREHGVTGFHYLFEDLNELEPLDEKTFNDPNRRFVCTATNCLTGKNEYFENGKCKDIFKAVQASATVPYASAPVMMDGIPYLDGGIACKIPVDWALEQNYDRIIIVRTRDASYRKQSKPVMALNHMYKKYPMIETALNEEVPHYNVLLDRIQNMSDTGRVFVIAPSVPVEIHRFESDVNKLTDLYYLGYEDTMKQMDALRGYLNKK